MSKQKIKYLVADTSAFIKNKALQDVAEKVYTVPDVINEIKVKRQIRRLVVLPFDLIVEEPFPENVQHVIGFAKKTGDYLSLSSVDIKIIALTYQFEKQYVGTEHLKTEPVRTTTVISKDRPIELMNQTPIAGFFVSKHDSVDINEIKDIVEVKDLESESSNEDNDNNDDDCVEDKELAAKIAELNFENLQLEVNSKTDDILVSVDESNKSREEESTKEAKHEEEESSSEEDECSSNEEEEDDDEGWITPRNVVDIKRDFGADVVEETSTIVACMSTDYAIQNVAKQIGLNVASFDGKVIREMRTYILRCYTCYKTTTILTKLFCPKCGNKTLKRVAVSLDNDGKQVIHVNTRRPLTAKGKNSSIPLIQGGKHSCNPILFEDQPIPKQMPTRVARTKTNALDDNYIAGYSPFVKRDADSKSAILRGKGNIKQLIKNNEYEDLRHKMKK